MVNIKAVFVNLTRALMLVVLVGCADAGDEQSRPSAGVDSTPDPISSTPDPISSTPPGNSGAVPAPAPVLGGGTAGEAGHVPTALLNTQSVGGGTAYTYRQLSAGGRHTCGVTDGAALRCWGMNTAGQLGVGDALSHSSPVAVGLPTGRTAAFVAAGRNFTCAVLDDSSLYCWGENAYGQLGLGHTHNQQTPQEVFSNGVSLVATGDDHTCAIMTNQDLYCWGRGSAGVLGVGSLEEKLFPVQVLSDVDKVTLGTLVTCAITRAGTPQAATRCWGRNHYGELGIGDASVARVLDASSAQTQLSGGWAEVAAGHHFTCGILQDGSATCWGRKHLGVLGSATDHVADAQANRIAASGGASKIAAGRDFVCILQTNGQVKCWGANHRSQLGRKTSQYVDANPGVVDLPPNTIATSITAGESHACAILNTGHSYCWGSDARGQLGIQLREIPNVVSRLHAGSQHTCAMANNAKLYCWGNGHVGQLGQGKISNLYSIIAPGVPTRLTNVPAGVKITSIRGGRYYTCAILSNGKGQCWGWNLGQPLGVDYSTFPAGKRHQYYYGGAPHKHFVPWNIDVLDSTDKVRDLDGALHTCAVLAGGLLKCWGNNQHSQAGAPPSYRVATAQTIPLGVGADGVPEKAVRVATGSAHSCVLLSSGLVKCWGSNGYGGLGLPKITLTRTLQTINFGTSSKAVALDSQFRHSCAVLENGDVYCWGANHFYQTADSTTCENSPAPIVCPPKKVNLNGEPAVSVVTGFGNSCAVLRNGKVMCWGIFWEGRNGLPRRRGVPLPPSIVPIRGRVVDISSGEAHACAMTAQGAVYCWGYNYWGQLGVRRGGWRIPVKVNLPN